MDFYAVLDQVIALLRQRGRASYRALKVQFQLDEEQLEALKEELIDIQEVVIDKDDKMLVWKGPTTAQDTERQKIEEAEPRPAPTYPDSGTDRPRDPRLDVAERRQLTVMFCDLVGSTVLSTHLDPEDYHTVVQQYHKTCEAVIQRYEGFVPQHLGDGVLVYFGYPAAHEDDAQRAVRTGLGVVEAIQQLSFPTLRLPHPVQVRIGIHTGLVVIGEIGGSEKRERLALGETPNLAARVQGVAEPNTVALSAVTHRLVQGLFECQELGQHELKGFAAPVVVYRVARESATQSRFEASVSAGLTPLVGREEELGVLRRRWEQVKAGSGHVVLLSGEPGIGKSRLMQELKEQVSAEGATRIEFRCSPYHQNSALYPIIDHLHRLLQFTREDTPAAKLAKLQQVLARYRFPQADTVPLLAAMLSLPHPEGYSPITVSPQKQKEKTQAALVAWIVEEAEQRPVYTVWEDLHWTDPSTLEVLTLLLDQVPTARLLALLTSRPEFISPWGSRSYLTQLTLNRLGQSQVEGMVKWVTGNTTLPSEAIQQIVSKTDGVPLFVEELTKTVVEAIGQQATGIGEQFGLSLVQIGVPPTLQDALMARLDRLGPAKEIAQLGATIGREFSYELLHAVANQDESCLQQGLRQLVETELIYQRGLPPQAHYLFKHALIQDTAYQSLLKSKRQQLHQQIAQVIEAQFPNTKETEPELLAYHYTEAGLTEQAIPYWQRAGQRASQRSAYVEAISHLTRGLELLKTLADTPTRVQSELALQVTLGISLMAARGYAAPEVGQALARALELCRQVGESPQLFRVLGGLAAFYVIRGELRTAHELHEQMLRVAQSVHDPVLLQVAHYGMGEGLFDLGELPQSRTHLEQAITLYDSPRRPFSGFHDTGVACLSIAALTLWSLGYPDQALKRIRESLTLAQELSHPFSVSFALHCAAELHQFRREVKATQEQAEALIALALEQGFMLREASGVALRGWALAEQGRGEEGVAQIRQGYASTQAMGAALFLPYFLALLAEAYAKVGQAEEGLTALAEGLTFVDEKPNHEAELYRLKGELTLQAQVESHKSQVKEQEAEECFLKAITIAKKQQAKSLELRAAMSLARLWQQQGKQKEAHQLLAEIYGWFTEGFDTKDLQEGKALLEELASR